jgi:hypothetical protein
MRNFNNIANNFVKANKMANGNGYAVKGYEFIWDDDIPRQT